MLQSQPPAMPTCHILTAEHTPTLDELTIITDQPQIDHLVAHAHHIDPPITITPGIPAYPITLPATVAPPRTPFLIADSPLSTVVFAPTPSDTSLPPIPNDTPPEAILTIGQATTDGHLLLAPSLPEGYRNAGYLISPNGHTSTTRTIGYDYLQHCTSQPARNTYALWFPLTRTLITGFWTPQDRTDHQTLAATTHGTPTPTLTPTTAASHKHQALTQARTHLHVAITAAQQATAYSLAIATHHHREPGTTITPDCIDGPAPDGNLTEQALWFLLATLTQDSNLLISSHPAPSPSPTV